MLESRKSDLRKMKTLLITLLFSNFVIAQTNGNIAKYFVTTINDEGIENMFKREDRYGLYKETIEGSKNLLPILVFSKHYAAFFVENPQNDQGILLASALYLDAPSKIIVDLEMRLKKKNNIEGSFKKEKYIITDTLQTNWTLVNETKYIDKYLCYKAIMTHSVKSRKGTVIAWYCPEIPYSFGPKGYGGLPGLILELNDKRGVIGLKTLRLNVPIDEKVLEIKGEEEISSENYNKLVEKLIFDE